MVSHDPPPHPPRSACSSRLVASSRNWHAGRRSLTLGCMARRYSRRPRQDGRMGMYVPPSGATMKDERSFINLRFKSPRLLSRKLGLGGFSLSGFPLAFKESLKLLPANEYAPPQAQNAGQLTPCGEI